MEPYDRTDYTTICDGRPPMTAYEVVRYKGLLYKIESTTRTYPWLLDVGILHVQYNTIVTLAGARVDVSVADPELHSVLMSLGSIPVTHIVAVAVSFDQFVNPNTANYQWPTSVQHTITEVLATMERILFKAQSSLLQRSFVFGSEDSTLYSPAASPPMSAHVAESVSTLPQSARSPLFPMWAQPYNPVPSPSTPSPLSLADY